MFWRIRNRRDIFTFWDGTQRRRIDPLPAWFAMSTDPDCNPENDFPEADNGDRDAWCRVQAMARRMFGVKAFSEGGLTEFELSTLLARFLSFVVFQKKKRDTYRTQWELSAGEPLDESTTPPESESSSTRNESSSDEPSESSQQCQPPSET